MPTILLTAARFAVPAGLPDLRRAALPAAEHYDRRPALPAVRPRLSPGRDGPRLHRPPAALDRDGSTAEADPRGGRPTGLAPLCRESPRREGRRVVHDARAGRPLAARRLAGPPQAVDEGDQTEICETQFLVGEAKKGGEPDDKTSCYMKTPFVCDVAEMHRDSARRAAWEWVPLTAIHRQTSRFESGRRYWKSV